MAIQRRKSARMVRRSKSVAVVTNSGEDQFENGSQTSISSQSNSTDNSLGKKWMSLMTTRLGRSVQEMIDSWSQLYSVDAETAFAKLLEYLLHLSGFVLEVDRFNFMTNDLQQVLGQLSQTRQDTKSSYPLKMNPKSKEVHQFELFVDIFVKQLHTTLISSELYLTKWFNWLTTMSQSPLRSVRHTATFVCLKWNAGLNGLMRSFTQSKRLLESNLKMINKNDSLQPENEMERDSQSSQSSVTLQIADYQNKITLTNKLCNGFDTVLEMHLCDSDPLIRTLCLEQLSFLIKNFPEIYIDQRFLSKIELTRFESTPKMDVLFLNLVKLILSFKEPNELVMQFVRNVFDDLISFALAADLKLSGPAFGILKTIFELNPELFSSEQLNELFNGVLALDLNYAILAGDFLVTYLKKDDNDSINLKLVTASGKHLSKDILILYNLIGFYRSLNFKNKSKFLANSLFKAHSIMMDWSSYVTLFTEEILNYTLLIEDEESLAQILLYFVKRCVKLPKDNHNKPKQKLTIAETLFIEKSKQEITSFFLVHLPVLLPKYRFSETVVSKLIKIVQYFDRNLFNQYETEVDLLFEEINLCIEVHNDSQTLRSCFKVYGMLLKQDHQTNNPVLEKFQMIIQKLSNTFQRDWELMPDLSTILTISTKLLAASEFMNLEHYRVWEDVYSNLLSSDHLVLSDESFCEKLIIGCRSFLIWQLRVLSTVKEFDFHEMQRRIFELFDFSRTLMNRERTFKLRRLGYLNASDMLVFFSHQLTNLKTSLKHLHYAPDENTIRGMCDFLQEDIIEEVSDFMADCEDFERHWELKRYLFAFSKLILFGIFSVDQSHHVLQHYALICYLNMEEIADRLFKMILKQPNWGNIMGISLFELSLRSDYEYSIDFSNRLINLIKPRKRHEIRQAESVQLAKMVTHVLSLISNDLKKNNDSFGTTLITLMPELMANMNEKHASSMKYFISENTSELLDQLPEDNENVQKFRDYIFTFA